MSYRPITDIWILARCKYQGGHITRSQRATGTAKPRALRAHSPFATRATMRRARSASGAGAVFLDAAAGQWRLINQAPQQFRPGWQIRLRLPQIVQFLNEGGWKERLYKHLFLSFG